MGLDLIEELQALAKRAGDLEGSIQGEEATKTALVMPMLKALGYDVFNPLEVIPEFTADVAMKKGEKVDYAIKNEDKISILIECKKVGEKLGTAHSGQLYRYFSVTAARFGILTNGVQYEFYSDLDERNKMDTKPFFVFDLYAFTDMDVRELKKFGKSKFAEDSILSAANDLKYARLIDAVLAQEFDTPSEELVKLIGARVYDGRMTANVMEWMHVLVKDALARIVRKKVRENLESALDQGKEQDAPSDLELEENSDGVVTTEQEVEAFNVIRAILSEAIDPKRVFMRDSKSYCAILCDDNNRKPISRLYLDGKQWRVSTFASKEETKHDIEHITDIFKISDLLKSAVSQYS